MTVREEDDDDDDDDYVDRQGNRMSAAADDLDYVENVDIVT